MKKIILTILAWYLSIGLVISAVFFYTSRSLPMVSGYVYLGLPLIWPALIPALLNRGGEALSDTFRSGAYELNARNKEARYKASFPSDYKNLLAANKNGSPAAGYPVLIEQFQKGNISAEPGVFHNIMAEADTLFTMGFVVGTKAMETLPEDTRPLLAENATPQMHYGGAFLRHKWLFARYSHLLREGNTVLAPEERRELAEITASVIDGYQFFFQDKGGLPKDVGRALLFHFYYAVQDDGPERELWRQKTLEAYADVLKQDVYKSIYRSRGNSDILVLALDYLPQVEPDREKRLALLRNVPDGVMRQKEPWEAPDYGPTRDKSIAATPEEGGKTSSDGLTLSDLRSTLAYFVNIYAWDDESRLAVTTQLLPALNRISDGPRAPARKDTWRQYFYEGYLLSKPKNRAWLDVCLQMIEKHWNDDYAYYPALELEAERAKLLGDTKAAREMLVRSATERNSKRMELRDVASDIKELKALSDWTNQVVYSVPLRY